MRKIAAFLIAAFTMTGMPVWAMANEKSDVLFIVVDDLNDWVGVLGGHPQTKTPNIDALANRGMLFTNAHATAPSCSPSRNATLTGVSPFNSGLYGQRGDWREVPALADKATLPRHFRDNGYTTLGAGKLFHAHTYSVEGAGGDQDVNAWDAYFPSMTRQIPDQLYPVKGKSDVIGGGRKSGAFDWAPVAATDEAMGDGQVTQWATRQLRAEHPGSRYISVGIYKPHLPWYVPQKYFDMHPLENVQLPPYLANDLDDTAGNNNEGWEPGMGIGRDLEVMDWIDKNAGTKWQEAVQGYLASISFADAMVGELIYALDRSGKADNTIIVLWSDHGWHLGEKRRWGKMTLWEEATHVPFIIVAPGVTTPGSRSDQAVSLQSIYATLSELAGLDTPDHVDGRSLVPLLKKPEMDWDDVAITTWGFGNYSVRGDDFRYIVYADNREELYDHRSDPNEWTNIAADKKYRAVLEELKSKLPPKSKQAKSLFPPLR